MRTISRAGERGAVTVEAALAMCSLILVVAMALAGLTAMSAQLRCVDAASEAARLTARGDRQRATEAAERLAPGGASIRIDVRGDEVSVEVSASAVTGLLPGLDVRARAMAVLEPGARP